MAESKGTLSPGGVWLADDFRDNLIIDRFDPVLSSMRASKMKHLKSQNSEDAVTWNVFRTLRQIDPMVWLPSLTQKAFPAASEEMSGRAIVQLWSSVPPPPSLVVDLDEGHSEIDVVLESDQWVWFVEAKYRSDISTGTTTRPDRDQVLRNIDVGSFYAGVRSFFFSLLVHEKRRSPAGVQAVEEYAQLDVPRRLLSAHRPDGLRNLRGVSLVTWADLMEVLKLARDRAPRDDERQYAVRAVEWLAAKGLGAGAV